MTKGPGGLSAPPRQCAGVKEPTHPHYPRLTPPQRLFGVCSQDPLPNPTESKGSEGRPSPEHLRAWSTSADTGRGHSSPAVPGRAQRHQEGPFLGALMSAQMLMDDSLGNATSPQHPDPFTASPIPLPPRLGPLSTSALPHPLPKSCPLPAIPAPRSAPWPISLA